MLHYSLSNKKEKTVLLLHGFCEDSRIWQHFMRAFTAEYQVLRIDLPGFGRSEITQKTSLAEMSRAIQGILIKEKIKKIHFVGHSMGGYVGLEFARQFPEYLDSLCMFHSQPFADTEEKKKARTQAAKIVANGGQKMYVHEVIRSLFASNKASGDLIKRLIDRARQYPAQGIENALLAMRDRVDHSTTLQKIKCPVQFIIGTEDTAVPSKASREQTHLPKVASIHFLPEIGHMGMFENSKLTKSLVKDFLHFSEDFTQNS